jgi:outer membrane lipase/esterase
VPNTPLASVCTNHAVGGGLVNVPGGDLLDDTPFAVPRQLEDMRKQSSFGADELLLLDGGGNDAALVFGVFLDAPQDNAQALLAVLADLLSADQVAAARAGGEAGWAAAGNTYMTALADRMADAIASQALAFGARRVVLLNMPDVSRTPRFTGQLALIASSEGADVAARRGAIASAWARTYNERLAQRLAGTGEVAIVDFRALLDGWIDDPQAAGFTNATTPACPVVGRDDQGLPSYDLRTCSETLLSANPAPGAASPDWWRTYLFSDYFHGTPRMNEKLGDEVLRVMTDRGWR